MNHLRSIAQAEERMSALEALRGTPQEPPALDAQVGQLLRTRAWHAVRLDQDHHNVGNASLYECSGRSKRSTSRATRLTATVDRPLDTLVLV